MLLASSGFVTLVLVAVWLYALFDAVTTPEGKIRGLQKPLWIIIILFGNILGAAAWFVLGRPRSTQPGGGLGGFGNFGGFGGSGGPRRPGRPGPIAPDDDPDFLRSLNRPRDGNDPNKPA